MAVASPVCGDRLLLYIDSANPRLRAPLCTREEMEAEIREQVLRECENGANWLRLSVLSKQERRQRVADLVRERTARLTAHGGLPTLGSDDDSAASEIRAKYGSINLSSHGASGGSGTILSTSFRQFLTTLPLHLPEALLVSTTVEVRLNSPPEGLIKYPKLGLINISELIATIEASPYTPTVQSSLFDLDSIYPQPGRDAGLIILLHTDTLSAMAQEPLASFARRCVEGCVQLPVYVAVFGVDRTADEMGVMELLMAGLCLETAGWFAHCPLVGSPTFITTDSAIGPIIRKEFTTMLQGAAEGSNESDSYDRKMHISQNITEASLIDLEGSGPKGSMGPSGGATDGTVWPIITTTSEMIGVLEGTEEKEGAPMAEKEEEVPMAEKEEEVPMAEKEEEVPMAEKEEEVPMAEKEEEVPMAVKEEEVPTAEKEEVPMAEKEEEVPMAEKEEEVPMAEKEEVPMAEKEEEVPLAEKEEVPMAEKEEEEVPMAEKDEEVPMAEKEEEVPMAEKEEEEVPMAEKEGEEVPMAETEGEEVPMAEKEEEEEVPMAEKEGEEVPMAETEWEEVPMAEKEEEEEEVPMAEKEHTNLMVLPADVKVVIESLVGTRDGYTEQSCGGHCVEGDLLPTTTLVENERYFAEATNHPATGSRCSGVQGHHRTPTGITAIRDKHHSIDPDSVTAAVEALPVTLSPDEGGEVWYGVEEYMIGTPPPTAAAWTDLEDGFSSGVEEAALASAEYLAGVGSKLLSFAQQAVNAPQSQAVHPSGTAISLGQGRSEEHTPVSLNMECRMETPGVFSRSRDSVGSSVSSSASSGRRSPRLVVIDHREEDFGHSRPGRDRMGHLNGDNTLPTVPLPVTSMEAATDPIGFSAASSSAILASAGDSANTTGSWLSTVWEWVKDSEDGDPSSILPPGISATNSSIDAQRRLLASAHIAVGVAERISRIDATKAEAYALALAELTRAIGDLECFDSSQEEVEELMILLESVLMTGHYIAALTRNGGHPNSNVGGGHESVTLVAQRARLRGVVARCREEFDGFTRRVKYSTSTSALSDSP